MSYPPPQGGYPQQYGAPPPRKHTTVPSTIRDPLKIRQKDTSNLRQAGTLLRHTRRKAILHHRAIVAPLHNLKAMGREAIAWPHTEGICKVLRSDQVGRLRPCNNSRGGIKHRVNTTMATRHPNSHHTEPLHTVRIPNHKDTLHLRNGHMELLLTAPTHSSKGILPNSNRTEHHRPKANTPHSNIILFLWTSNMDNLHHHSKGLMAPHPKRYPMELRLPSPTAPLRQCRLHLRLDTFPAK